MQLGQLWRSEVFHGEELVWRKPFVIHGLKTPTDNVQPFEARTASQQRNKRVLVRS